MPVQVIVEFRAAEEKLPAFLDIMKSVSNDLPKVNGCSAVLVLRSSDDPCRFTLIETWDSSDHHQAHIDELVANGTWHAISQNLIADPVSGYFQIL